MTKPGNGLGCGRRNRNPRRVCNIRSIQLHSIMYYYDIHIRRESQSSCLSAPPRDASAPPHRPHVRLHDRCMKVAVAHEVGDRERIPGQSPYASVHSSPPALGVGASLHLPA